METRNGFLMSHAENVERYIGKGESERCEVVLADWPYECEAKDKYSDHTVYVCDTHHVWWHESPHAPANPSLVRR